MYIFRSTVKRRLDYSEASEDDLEKDGQKLVVKMPAIEEQLNKRSKVTASRGRGRGRGASVTQDASRGTSTRGRGRGSTRGGGRNTRSRKEEEYVPADYKMQVVEKKDVGYQAPENIKVQLENFFNQRRDLITIDNFYQQIQGVSGATVSNFLGIRPVEKNENQNGQNQNQGQDANNIVTGGVTDVEKQTLETNGKNTTEDDKLSDASTVIVGGDNTGGESQTANNNPVTISNLYGQLTNGEEPKILPPNGDTNSGVEKNNTGRDNNSELQNNNGHLPSATGSSKLPSRNDNELQNEKKKRNDRRQDRFNVEINRTDGDEEMKKEDSEHDLNLVRSVINCEVKLGQRVPNRSPVKLDAENKIIDEHDEDDNEETDAENDDVDTDETGGVYISDPEEQRRLESLKASDELGSNEEDPDEQRRMESLKALDELGLNEEEFAVAVQTIEDTYVKEKEARRRKEENRIQDEGRIEHHVVDLTSGTENLPIDLRQEPRFNDPPSVTRVNAVSNLDQHIQITQRKVMNIKQLVTTVTQSDKNAIKKMKENLKNKGDVAKETVSEKEKKKDSKAKKKDSKVEKKSDSKAQKKTPSKGEKKTDLKVEKKKELKDEKKTDSKNKKTEKKDENRVQEQKSLFERTLDPKMKRRAEELGDLNKNEKSTSSSLEVVSEYGADSLGGVTDAASGSDDASLKTVDYTENASGERY